MDTSITLVCPWGWPGGHMVVVTIPPKQNIRNKPPFCVVWGPNGFPLRSPPARPPKNHFRRFHWTCPNRLLLSPPLWKAAYAHTQHNTQRASRLLVFCSPEWPIWPCADFQKKIGHPGSFNCQGLCVYGAPRANQNMVQSMHDTCYIMPNCFPKGCT